MKVLEDIYVAYIPTLAVLPYNITYYPMLKSNYFHHCWEQGRNEVRWRPGQEASLASPVSNLKLLRTWDRKQMHAPCSHLMSEANALYWRKYLPHCWGFSAPPVVIRRPHSDSAPGKLFPLAPLVASPAERLDTT